MSKAAKICALYVDKDKTGSSTDWLRICKSTTLTITMNPETEDFDYIADEVKTTEVKAYAPTIDQDLAILASEPDYQYFYELWKSRPVGEDAHKNFLVVMLNDKTGSNYYAFQQEAVVSFTDVNTTDGVINFEIAFCGTKIDGSATLSSNTATFTKASTSED